MDTLPMHKQIDMRSYEQPDGELPTKYGLPKKVTFCKKCVMSNQRPSTTVEFKHTSKSQKETIHFDEDGVCDACRFTEMKKEIDWEERELMLKEICDRYRSEDGSYDCVVPGSGGKDSFYVSHQLKYEYGMHPLTVTWAPHMYTPWDGITSRHGCMQGLTMSCLHPTEEYIGC